MQLTVSRIFFLLIIISLCFWQSISLHAQNTTPCGQSSSAYDKSICYLELGKKYQTNGEYSLAINQYQNAQKNFIISNDSDQSELINKDISSCYEQLQLLEKAIEFQEKYITYLMDKKPKSVELIDAKEKLADLKAANQQYDEAQEEIRSVNTLQKEIQNTQGVVRSAAKYKTYANKKRKSSSVAQQIENDDELELLEDVEEEMAAPSSYDIENDDEIDDNELVETYDALGDFYSSEGQIDKAIEFNEKAAETANKVGRKDLYTENNIELSDQLFKSNQPDQAIQKLEETYKVLDNKNAPAKSDLIPEIQLKQKVLKNLSIAYQKTGNIEMANQTLEKYASTLDTAFQKRLKEIEVATTLYNTQQQLEIVEKEKEAETSKLKSQADALRYQKWMTFISLSALAITFLALIFIYRNAKAKRKANQLLALKSLRSQMNPHFIFNALNSVNGFISQNDERSANKFLAEFSKLMRMVMEYSEHDFIQLHEEIEILKLYLKLEHYRFKEKFDYTFTIDDDLTVEQYQIPPMLIQPYIENAVWHGLRYKEEFGALKVNIGLIKNTLTITIVDDGIGRKKSSEIKTKNQRQQVSTGMRNIDARLQIINELYNTKVSVLIEDLNTDGSGTKVLISIPNQSFKS